MNRTNYQRKAVLVHCHPINDANRVACALHHSLPDRTEPLWIMIPIESKDQIVEVIHDGEVKEALSIEILSQPQFEDYEEIEILVDPSFDDK